MSKTINSAIKQFTTYWNKAVELRFKAAKIYAAACNQWDYGARNAFKGLTDFSSWTREQWNLLYFIGSVTTVKDAHGNDIERGIIPPCYIGFARPSLPLCMRRHKVPYTDMEKLFKEGAILADINGKQKLIQIRYLQNKHIRQLYDENGHKRSILQQLKWLRDHQRPNIEVLDGGIIHVHHRCYINKETLLKVLTESDNPPLTAAELFIAAQKVAR